MVNLRILFLWTLLVILIASGCSGSTPTNILPTLTLAAPTVMASSSDVRICDYLPGKSTPAQIPSVSSQPAAYPTATPMTFTQSSVDAATLTRQMDTFNQIVKDITNHYYSLDFNGVDWNSIQGQYKALIQKGLSQADFNQAMSQMVSELGDAVSYYQAPSTQATPTTAPSNNYVGIGIPYMTLTGLGQDSYVLYWVYSGYPADEAGLKSHDILLKVDGLPFLDENGTPRALGPAGTTLTLTVQTPGQAPRDVKMVRQHVSLTRDVDDCLVAGTSIGYIRWFDINNGETVAQTIEALKQLNASNPLQGLIIDLRGIPGPDLPNIQPLVSLFTSGNLSSFIAPRGDVAPIGFTANPADVSGSQKLPLIVLQDQDTGGAALTTGVLQLTGRARIVGQTADGSVCGTFSDNFPDGSFLSIKNAIFQPEGKTLDYWKNTGVVPDVLVNGRWDQFTEANDPYLAKAIELLMPMLTPK